jgi:hypothetical protein
MVSPDLLRQLGWSESLIQEVTRSAEKLERDNRSVGRYRIEDTTQLTTAGTALHMSEVPHQTGQRVSFSAKDKNHR